MYVATLLFDHSICFHPMLYSLFHESEFGCNAFFHDVIENIPNTRSNAAKIMAITSQSEHFEHIDNVGECCGKHVIFIHLVMKRFVVTTITGLI